MASKKTNTAKASATTRRARAIYDEQKKDYQDMLKTKCRQGKKPTVAAREASEAYKKLYGSTPTARWRRALRMARMDRATAGFGTMSVTERPARPKKKKGGRR